jgi:hypothetical protein
MVGSVVFLKKLLSHLVVLCDGGRSVVKVLSNIVRGGGLIRRGGDEWGSSSVKRHDDKRVFIRGGVWCR